MADMLRVIDHHCALIRQTELKIQEVRQQREELEHQEQEELARKAALADELQHLHTNYMGAVAERNQVESELQAAREQNEGLKQEIGEVLEQYRALMEASRMCKVAFSEECMRLEGEIKAAKSSLSSQQVE